MAYICLIRSGAALLINGVFLFGLTYRCVGLNTVLNLGSVGLG